jgi:hypothetical protein
MLDFSGVVTPKKASPLHVADIVRDAFFMGVLHCSGAWTTESAFPRPLLISSNRDGNPAAVSGGGDGELTEGSKLVLCWNRWSTSLYDVLRVPTEDELLDIESPVEGDGDCGDGD